MLPNNFKGPLVIDVICFLFVRMTLIEDYFTNWTTGVAVRAAVGAAAVGTGSAFTRRTAFTGRTAFTHKTASTHKMCAAYRMTPGLHISRWWGRGRLWWSRLRCFVLSILFGVSSFYGSVGG